MLFKLGKLVWGIAVVIAMQPTALTAQETDSSRTGAASVMLEEILVTARKKGRAEAVQDIPLAISAYSAEQLEAQFVTKLDDLSYSAPNVQLEAVGTFPGVQNFSIRGQGINSSIPSVDPTVGTFIDGIYLGVTYGVVLDMFDLETVEILRGPQGLLFGRNVTGGAVSIRTARPDGDFGIKAKVNVTGNDQITLATAVKFAVSDNLAGKVVLYTDQDDGYFDNNYTGSPDLIPGVDPFYFNQTDIGENAGQLDTSFVRTGWVWDASDNLEFVLNLETGESDGSGAAWTRVDLQRSGAIDEFTTTQDETGTTEIEWSQAILEANLNVDFGEGVITNILGWRDLSSYSVADVDGFAASIFTVPGNTEQDQISNELRYAGTLANGRWDVTAGIYYFSQDIGYREGRFIQDGALRIALGGDMDHTTWGLFWNNDYHLTDAMTLSAGLRYTDEEKNSQVIDATNGSCTDVTTFVCDFADLDGAWSNVTPKLGLSYDLNDDAQLYTFWTKGFRSGGVNFRNAKPSVIAPGPTNEEEQNNFEVGLKSTFNDGRIRLNVAAFYNTIDNMQRELNLPDPDVIVLQGTINAGDATIQGVELDFTTLLTDNFSINASAGYLSGEWDRREAQFDPATATNQALIVGDELPRLAPLTATLGMTYDADLGELGYLTLRGSYSYRDRAAYLDSNLEFFDVQHQVSASIDYRTLNDQWRVSLYGKNLNDEARWGNLTLVSFGTVGPMQKGRVVGLEIAYGM